MKKLFISLAFMAAASLSAQTDYSAVYNGKAFVQKGIQLYEEEKYDAAMAEFKKVDALDPEYGTAQYEMALTLSAQEKKEELKAHFETLYKSKWMKKLPTLYTLYGSFLSDAEKYEESEKIFKEGLQFIPNNTNHQYNLAVLFYRAKKVQECVDILKKIIANNPNSASSHYLLGSVALENGKIAEGSMALLSYLMIAPTGKFAKNAVFKLNAKMGENYMEKSKVVFSKSGDNYEELETILRNQLPLRSAYKIQAKIDDVVTRQVQAILEYTQMHKMGDGFFETTYMPWLKSVADSKQIEGFSYYILMGLEEELGKNLLAQKKKILQFSEDFIAKDFWSVFARRKMNLFGEDKEVIIYVNDGVPNLIGSVVNGKKEGKFKLLNEFENLDGELQFANDELNGLQKYYNEEGKVYEEKNYTNGKLNGKRTVYYPSGSLSLEENYKDGELDGKSTSYHIAGGINCDGTFTNGEINGTLTCYYPTGTKKTESSYANGKLEGVYNSYNKAGDLASTETYKNGELEGKYTKFYGPKAIQEEAEYKAGKVVGSFKKYHTNGKLEEEFIYTNGKVSASAEYYATGVKSGESTYNEKGELMATTYFNPSGEKYYDEVFNSKEIKLIRQYSRDNAKPTEINLARKSFEIKTLDGKVVATGAFEKGRRNGQWKFQTASGKTETETAFVKGEREGITKNYSKNGLLNSISFYAKDTLQGINEVYNDRGLKRMYNYRNGNLNGPYKVFYADGSVLNDCFYDEDELEGERRTFSQSCQLLMVDHMFRNITLSTDYYNTKGEVVSTIAYDHKSGSVNHSVNNGAYTSVFDIKNGYLDGKYDRKDKFNKPMVEGEYKCGAAVNVYKEYGPNDTILLEQSYYNGSLNGLSKNYDLTGHLKITSEYNFGVENGKTIRYYHNKSKMYEYSQQNDVKEGDFTYYNLKGEPLMTIFFLDDAPQYYIKKSKTGELNEKVMIVNETGTLTSNYPNGKVALQITFNKGNKEGEFFINNDQGKPEYKAFYKNDVVHNDRIEYYANGNIYLKEHFVSNDYEGLQEYFKEDGKPWIKAEYKNDELHGKTQIFTNGVLTLTKKYDSDYLVDVIK